MGCENLPVFCAHSSANRGKGPGVRAGNGFSSPGKESPRRGLRAAPHCLSHLQFHIFRTRESSVEGILADGCTWSTMKIGNEEVVADPGREEQSFGRLQTLLAQPAAQQLGIRKDLPQIHSTWAVS